MNHKPVPPSLLAHALGFAARGWPVFPMASDKRPAGGCGLKHAATDPDQVARLFATDGAVSVAIATGSTSGVSAIDIDPAAIEWHKARRFRPTWAEQTPRGGWHLLYEHPPGLRCSAGKLARGVDIRAEGGSCILWGPGYKIIDGRDPEPFPGWVLGLLARIDRKRQQDQSIKTEYEGCNLDGLKRWVERLGPGERNHGLFWAACRAGKDAGALLPAAIACGLDAREARGTLLSAMRRTR